MVIAIKFLDTNYLLKNYNSLADKFVISSISLHELEHIKTSNYKDENTKYQARKAIRFLDNNPDRYETIVNNSEITNILQSIGLESNADNQICAAAYYYNKNCKKITFCTDDICCKMIAKTVFDLNVLSSDCSMPPDYSGYIEKTMNETDLAYFYSNLTSNSFNLLVNQYLIIKNESNEIIDKLRWTGDEYQNVKYNAMKSNYLGTIKPYDSDVYQQCAINSMQMNQVTMIKGPAGTGKSYLSLGFLFSQLEKHKIDKIVVFCNTVATANSAKLGFYPGSKDEKLLDSTIGNMLGSKLGGIYAVEQLINENKLTLLPFSDIRGFDTTGMNCGVYITEAQNLDISLMKLALQRIGDDSVCIIDGDYNAQVDLSHYAGANNGMRRMSEVFRGQDFYGEVELKNIYRSRIAEIAEQM